MTKIGRIITMALLATVPLALTSCSGAGGNANSASGTYDGTDITGTWTGTATVARAGNDQWQAQVELDVDQTGQETFEFDLLITGPTYEFTFDGAGVISPNGRLLAPLSDMTSGILVDSQIVSDDEITWMMVEVFEPTDNVDSTQGNQKKMAMISHLTRVQ